MKVKYIGETKDIKTVSGKDARLSKNMELECMEKEYHSAMTVRVTLASGEHVKIGRKELQKIAVCWEDKGRGTVTECALPCSSIGFSWLTEHMAESV